MVKPSLLFNTFISFIFLSLACILMDWEKTFNSLVSLNFRGGNGEAGHRPASKGSTIVACGNIGLATPPGVACLVFRLDERTGKAGVHSGVAAFAGIIAGVVGGSSSFDPSHVTFGQVGYGFFV
jgi:hypothetical protein